MPHISLTLYTGRSKEEIERLSLSMQKCLMETAGWKANDISVSVEGIEPEKFVSKVSEKTKSEKIVIASNIIK